MGNGRGNLTGSPGETRAECVLWMPLAIGKFSEAIGKYGLATPDDSAFTGYSFIVLERFKPEWNEAAGEYGPTLWGGGSLTKEASGFTAGAKRVMP